LLITGVAFGSYAKRIGLDVGYSVVAVLKPAEQIPSILPIGAALLVTLGIALLQNARRRRGTPPPESAEPVS
jgi:hypothetical protein